MPLVSIVIPAYNAAAFIHRSVASIQQQTLTDLEILVVDDASTDDTIATVEALIAEGAEIRLLRQEKNGGVAVARNTGIDQARGRYIAFLDADDIFLPERLEHLVQQAEAQQLDVVGDNQVLLDLHLGRHVGATAFNPTAQLKAMDALTFLKRANNIPSLREILSGHRGTYSPLIKPMIRRDFLTQHGLRYDPACKIGEDFDLHIRCLLEGARAALVPQAYYVYTLAYSDYSATRSPHSRTVLNLKPVLRNIDQLLQRYGGRLSPVVRRELVRCKSGARGLERFEQLKTDLYRGRVHALLGLFALPVVWRYTARSTTIKLRHLSTRLLDRRRARRAMEPSH
ncbi:succinoglycan biosynthesis protein ExoO [Pseudoxanthomonas sp. GM95]|uniref:glycosyltransferase family 2 protein n=1 Tax=Pseudoxanthomonas sp. GM95 TaxID=1881043 RepID=UPI0008C7FD1F|nr:glycosyltransferase family 2 protein [Pseudoxanthomonas sp. GM95]SEK52527.1 succinoglycan biosynthesis protein ExoO [Pseudoxanthomonas sp. GM95]